MDIIIQGLTLFQLETEIKNKLYDLDYWGDLDVSPQEYTFIRDKIKESVRGIPRRVIDLCKSYPCTMATLAVFMLRYRVNYNFWDLLCQEIGTNIDPNDHRDIGMYISYTFKKNGFDCSAVANDQQVNIAPIRYQACLPPDSCLDDLFWLLSSDSMSNLGPREIINEIVEVRHYSVRSALLDFLTRFRDSRAIDYVMQVHDSMISVEQGFINDSNYVLRYKAWKDDYKSGKKRNSRELQAYPRLFFDQAYKGLCIRLPKMSISDGWIEEARWVISLDDETVITSECNVYGYEERRYVEGLDLAVKPSSSYEIKLVDSDADINSEPYFSFKLTGMSDNGYLLFNKKGNVLNNKYLNLPYVICIRNRDTSIVNVVDVNIEDKYYSNLGNDYVVEYIVPLSDFAEISINSIRFTARPELKVNLYAKKLFGIQEFDGLPILVELPKVNIQINNAIDVDKLEMRFGNLLAIKLKEYICEDEIVVDLNKLLGDYSVEYGVFHVDFYEERKYLGRKGFKYVPSFKTNFLSGLCWLNEVNRRESTKLKISKLDGWSLYIENCKMSSDENEYFIDFPATTSVVKGQICSKDEEYPFVCDFEFPIKPVSIQVVSGENVYDVTSKSRLLSKTQLVEENNTLVLNTYGSFKDNQYYLCLENSDGILQRFYLNTKYTNGSILDLSLFSDTLKHCALPATISLMTEDKEPLNILTVHDSTDFSYERPKYGNGYLVINSKEEIEDIVVRKFGDSNFELLLHRKESVISKKDVTKRGYKCNVKLDRGLYNLEASKREESFFGFELDFAEVDDSKNTIYVKGDNLEDRSKNIDLFISRILVSAFDSSELNNALRRFAYIKQEVFDEDDYYAFIILGYLYCSNISRTKKKQIELMMRQISVDWLTAENRTHILELLVEFECSQEIFDACLCNYALWLCGRSLNYRNLASAVDTYSTELSMVILMKNDAHIKSVLGSQKYRSLIGSETAEIMIDVPKAIDKNEKRLELGKFSREESSKVAINITSDISGSMESIRKMMVELPYVYLDFSKKPEDGCFFAGIRFVDQYCNWYRNSHVRGEMKEEIRALMDGIIKNYFDEVIKGCRTLMQISSIKKHLRIFVNAIEARSPDNYTGRYPDYFYIQAIAAYMSLLPEVNEDVVKYKIIGERIICDALVIAPRLSKRDYIMACTYAYLCRKEVALCQ